MLNKNANDMKEPDEPAPETIHKTKPAEVSPKRQVGDDVRSQTSAESSLFRRAYRVLRRAASRHFPSKKPVPQPASDSFGECFDQKEISINEAQRLADHDIQGDLYKLVLGVQELDDETAEALSHCKRWLSLPHLTSLRDSPGHLALARKLGSQGFWTMPEPLNLNGLTAIADAAAKEIAAFDSEDLLLNGLTELTDDTAKCFADNKGPRIYLNGVLELSDNAAGWLAGYEGFEIHMCSLTKLNGGVGHVALIMTLLSQSPGSYNLDCLQEVSDEVFQSIVDSKRGQAALSLNGLNSLPASIAEILSKTEHKIFLNGVEHISDAAAEHLSKLRKPIELLGLKRLSSRAAELLRLNPECKLPD